jgi:hypothetical protein
MDQTEEQPKEKTGFWRHLFFGGKPNAEPFKWPTWGCKHKWGPPDKTILESAFEQMDKAGLKPTDVPPIWYFRKKVFIIMICTECGAVKKYSDAVNPSPP